MQTLSVVVFALTLVGTLFVSWLGRRHEQALGRRTVSGQHLNRWLVGLSAGATANSGFVVTAAVALGYTGGMRWLLLPFGWLLGDILFWIAFPNRINAAGAAASATTLTDVIAYNVGGRRRRLFEVLIGGITLVCLGGYVSAQWLAGQKFLAGAFGFQHLISLVVFAGIIILYSALGGFRGSVYADTYQAMIRILGTGIAIVVVSVVASRHSGAFWLNIQNAGSDFLHLVPSGGYVAALGSALGFGAAALGFGLGQPQIVTRYFAGESPGETQSAWWIYMLFVQATWVAMTVFGALLRGVMPSIADPEMGLSIFHRSTTGPVITGLIAGDVFATIASASNSILVAMAQSFSVDLLGARRTPDGEHRHRDLWPVILILGIITMAFSLSVQSSVLNLALSSVSLMGAGLAPAMIVRVMNWRHSADSLLAAIVLGMIVAGLWRFAGYSAFVNEAAPGIVAGLVGNALLAPRVRLRVAQAGD